MPNYDILSILRKVKIIAAKTWNNELLEWINLELNWYPNWDNVPDYRKTYYNLTWTISNGRIFQNNVALPIAHLDDNIKEWLTRAIFTESLSELIALRNWEGDALSTNIDPNYFHFIDKVYWYWYRVQSATWMLPFSVIDWMLWIISDKVLEFLLELSKVTSPDEEIVRLIWISDKSTATRIENFTQQIIHWNLVTTTNQVNSTWDVIINYIEELKSRGIHEDDIEELKAIAKIKNETEKEKQKNWWIKKVWTYLPTITVMVDFIDTALEALI